MRWKASSLLFSAPLVVLVAACGLSVVGAEPLATEDGGGAALPANADGSATSDATAITNSDGNVAANDATVIDSSPPPVCAEDLANCGGCNLACPANTDACMAGKCIATLNVAVRIDGYDDLVIQGGTVRWHHLTWTVPQATTLDGVVWTPTYPPEPSGCDYCGDPGPGGAKCYCESTNTGSLAPAIAAHDQIGAVTAMTGRGTVTVGQQPAAANNYALVIRFSDPEPGNGDFTATITYESR